MSKIPPYINIHTHKRVEGEVSIEIVGVHPYDAESGMKLTADSILEHVEAIGEIGLDFSRIIDRSVQETLFCEQLSVAEQAQLPVVIHSVRSMDKCMELLEKFSLRAVIFHGFIGSYHQAKMAISKGYYLSFGHRCFASPKTLDALGKVPLINIFFETDESDVSIEDIYIQAAKYRVEPMEDIKEQIYNNYIKIFKR